MASLPCEILHQILADIRESNSIASILPSLTVCKTWSDAALQVLYQHLVFDNNSLPRFLQCKAGRNGPLAVSLTLRLHAHRMSDEPLEPELLALAEQVPTFSNLKSFSIFVEDTYPGYIMFSPSGPRATTIVKFIQSLPESVTNLELDTNAYEACPLEVHICPYIRTLLPRLHRLVLRLRTVCEETLCHTDSPNPSSLEEVVKDDAEVAKELDAPDKTVPLAPELQMLSISFVKRLMRLPQTPLLHCKEASTLPEGEYQYGNVRLFEDSRVAYAPSPLAGRLAHLFREGQFPLARRLQVCQYENHEYGVFFEESYSYREDGGWEDREVEPIEELWNKRRQFHLRALVVRDAVRDVTIPLPWALFHYRHGTSGGTRSQAAIHDRDDVAWMGTTDATLWKGEDTGWVESKVGKARIPLDLASDVQRHDFGLIGRVEWERGEHWKWGPHGFLWPQDRILQGLPKIRRVFEINGCDTPVEAHMLPETGDNLPYGHLVVQ